MKQALFNLWHFGTVRYPGDDESVRGDWAYSFDAIRMRPRLLEAQDWWRDMVGRDPWLQRLCIAEARWLLVKAVAAGAAVGLWLALRGGL